MSDSISIGSLLGATGGTGAVIVGMYLAYKICLRKKVASKCCGGEFNIQNQDSNPTAVVQVATPTPPAVTPVVPSTPVKVSSTAPATEVPALSV